MKTPLQSRGIIQFTYTVYAIDKNCVPWKPTNWFVSGMNNVIAWPLNGNKFKALAFWSILNPHGSGSVTILSTTEVGTAASKDIGVSW